MKLGIVGLSGAGKTTVFTALTHQTVDPGHKGESLIGTIRVPDSRMDTLQALYRPKKLTHARIEYALSGKRDVIKASPGEASVWAQIRDCHALIYVIRNFVGFDGKEPALYHDYSTLDAELILTDQMVLENRLERLELDHKRGKKYDPTEYSMLKRCREHLEKGLPLRKDPALSYAPQLRGYAFISAKPVLVLFNNDDDIQDSPSIPELTSTEICVAIRGRLEQEMAQMAPAEAEEFLEAFGITAMARDQLIQKSYTLLGLISFFTVVGHEVRAWAIPIGTSALGAAGVVHTDMKRGFIRAEVISFTDLAAAGSYQAAKKQGIVRLEGKTYQVQDGDIINFRFNI